MKGPTPVCLIGASTVATIFLAGVLLAATRAPVPQRATSDPTALPRHLPDQQPPRARPRGGGRRGGDAGGGEGPLRWGARRQPPQRFPEHDAVHGVGHPELLELRRTFRAGRPDVLVAGRTELPESSLHGCVAV